MICCSKNENTIKIVRGTSNNLSITVTDEGGNLYELSPNEIIKFGVKSDLSTDEYEIYKEIDSDDYDEDEGVYIIKIDPADTLDLAPGLYYYDVGIQNGDDYYVIIPKSKFLVTENVTIGVSDDD